MRVHANMPNQRNLTCSTLAANGLELLEDPDAAAAANEGRWLAWVTASNELCLSHLPVPTRKGRGGTVTALHTLSLLPGEHIVQVKTLGLPVSWTPSCRCIVSLQTDR